MNHMLTATSEIDLHPLPGGSEHILLIGNKGPRATATRAGLEHLTMKLITYLWGENAVVVLRGSPAIT